MSSTFTILSFGCRVNQAEGEALAARLREAGLCDAPPGALPDFVVVNTCAVTAEAARQCRQQVRKALRTAARVAVTGCAAHPAAGDRRLAAIEGVEFLGPDKDAVAAHLASLAGPARCEREKRRRPRSRALLKIQDGCPAACAYCVVRLVRPEPRSLPVADAVRRAEALVAEGYREIVVCGIHLGLYGADLGGGADLPALIARLLAVGGLGRVRLSSLDPMEVSPRLLEVMAASPRRVCPHLHLPLQSGDDAVLRRMNRPYTADEFLAQIGRIREALDRPALGTDVLVGFPGETEAAFERTLQVCRAARFTRMHVFPFSSRPGTPAAAMDGRVPGDVTRARRARAAEVAESLARAYREALVGAEADVAIERLDEDAAEGTSERYVRVRLRGPLPENVRRRALVRVTLTAATEDGMEGAAR